MLTEVTEAIDSTGGDTKGPGSGSNCHSNGGSTCYDGGNSVIGNDCGGDNG